MWMMTKPSRPRPVAAISALRPIDDRNTASTSFRPPAGAAPSAERSPLLIGGCAVHRWAFPGCCTSLDRVDQRQAPPATFPLAERSFAGDNTATTGGNNAVTLLPHGWLLFSCRRSHHDIGPDGHGRRPASRRHGSRA